MSQTLPPWASIQHSLVRVWFCLAKCMCDGKLNQKPDHLLPHLLQVAQRGLLWKASYSYSFLTLPITSAGEQKHQGWVGHAELTAAAAHTGGWGRIRPIGQMDPARKGMLCVPVACPSSPNLCWRWCDHKGDFLDGPPINVGRSLEGPVGPQPLWLPLCSSADIPATPVKPGLRVVCLGVCKPWQTEIEGGPRLSSSLMGTL